MVLVRFKIWKSNEPLISFENEFANHHHYHHRAEPCSASHLFVVFFFHPSIHPFYIYIYIVRFYLNDHRLPNSIPFIYFSSFGPKKSKSGEKNAMDWLDCPKNFKKPQKRGRTAAFNAPPFQLYFGSFFLRNPKNKKRVDFNSLSLSLSLWILILLSLSIYYINW